jgi:dynein heavy chain, axonemal
VFQGATLKRLSDMVRGQLTPLQRLKLIALITIEVHNRDIIERLIKANCVTEKDFEWRSRLDFIGKYPLSSHFEMTLLTLTSHVLFNLGTKMKRNVTSAKRTPLSNMAMNTSETAADLSSLLTGTYFNYADTSSFTFAQTNVILTLTTALSLKRGGSPQGPAGTGNTETLKDPGKALAK